MAATILAMSPTRDRAPRLGRPGLPEHEAEAVRALLRRVYVDRFGSNATACAAALGLTQSAVSQILSRRNAPSYKTAQALARYLTVDVGNVLRGDVGTPAAQDRYPERAAALARLRGILPAEVEERVRATVVHDDETALSEADWIELAMMRLREHERASSLRARVGHA